MNIQPSSNVLGVLLIGILLFPLTSNSQVSMNWEYTFDTADSLNDWHISHGNFTSENGVLEVNDCELVSGSCYASIWKNVTEIEGIWSFDYYHNNTQNSHGLYFYFVGKEITVDEFGNPGMYPRYGYAISIGKDGSSSIFYQPDANTLFPIWFDSSPSLSVPNGWFHYEITRNSTGYMSVVRDDIQILQATDNNVTSSEYINFQFEYDSKIDNFSYQAINPPSNTENRNDRHDYQKIIIILFSLGSILMLNFYTKRVSSKKKQIKSHNLKKFNFKRLGESIQEFELSDTSIVYFLSGTHVTNKNHHDTPYKDQIPQELLNYRFLLHPIRLMMMKLLNNENKMKSFDIKNALGISWGDFSNHMKALKEKDYVEIIDEFNNEGHVYQAVQIQEKGRRAFSKLFKLLQEFTSSESLYAQILADEDKNSVGDYLYPL